jgi:hypothetical protein
MARIVVNVCNSFRPECIEGPGGALFLACTGRTSGQRESVTCWSLEIEEVARQDRTPADYSDFLNLLLLFSSRASAFLTERNR